VWPFAIKRLQTYDLHLQGVGIRGPTKKVRKKERKKRKKERKKKKGKKERKKFQLVKTYTKIKYAKKL